MTEHPMYPGDVSISMVDRPCAAQVAEGPCEQAAAKIGVKPGAWISPHSGSYGWVCSAHERVLTEKHQPERIEAMRVQLAREGREFWETYGEESGETPHVSQRDRELDSLNSDV